eukprot:Nk52_evm1s315 gene=Nk52_evmTU1s315
MNSICISDGQDRTLGSYHRQLLSRHTDKINSICKHLKVILKQTYSNHKHASATYDTLRRTYARVSHQRPLSLEESVTMANGLRLDVCFVTKEMSSVDPNRFCLKISETSKYFSASENLIFSSRESSSSFPHVILIAEDGYHLMRHIDRVSFCKNNSLEQYRALYLMFKHTWSQSLVTFKTQNTGTDPFPATGKEDKNLSACNVCITGTAGTGKSYVIRKVQRTCEERKLKCQIVAFTGCAAAHVGGQTIDSFIIDVHQTEDLDDVLDVLIIDEISMVSAELFERLSLALQGYGNHHFQGEPSRLPFRGVQVLVVGDFCQLNPVKGGPVYTHIIWHQMNFQHVELVTPFRATQSGFFDLLKRMQRGQLTECDINVLRGRDTDLSTDQVPLDYSSTHLFFQNTHIDKFNEDAAKNALGDECPIVPQSNEEGQEHTVSSFLNKDNVDADDDDDSGSNDSWSSSCACSEEELYSGPSENEHDDDECDDCCIAETNDSSRRSNCNSGEQQAPKGHHGSSTVALTLAAGLRVMVTHNIDVDAGIYNGTKGTIVSVDRVSGDVVIARDDTENETFTIHKGLPKRVLRRSDKKSINILKQCYPLRHCYALSIHKSQAQTLPTIAIHGEGMVLTKKSFEEKQRLFYVALSRARQLDTVQLFNCSIGFLDALPEKQVDLLPDIYTPPTRFVEMYSENAKTIEERDNVVENKSKRQRIDIKQSDVVKHIHNNVIYYDIETRVGLNDRLYPYAVYLIHYRGKDGDNITRKIFIEDGKSQSTFTSQSLWSEIAPNVHVEELQCRNPMQSFTAYVMGQVRAYAAQYHSVRLSEKEDKERQKKSGKGNGPKSRDIDSFCKDPLVLAAYNGNRFDNTFFLNEYFKKSEYTDVYQVQYIEASGGLKHISFKLCDLDSELNGKAVLFMHDLCQIINCPLKKAIKDYGQGTHAVKGEFPHLYMNEHGVSPLFSLETVALDVDKHFFSKDKEEVQAYEQDLTQYPIAQKFREYLFHDVETLPLLYEKLNEVVQNVLPGDSIKHICTSNSLAQRAFLMHLPTECISAETVKRKGVGGRKGPKKMCLTKLQRFYPKEEAKIREAIIGGKTLPRIMEFRADEKNPLDYLVYLDISGMYVSIMKTHSFPIGEFHYASDEERIQIVRAIESYNPSSWIPGKRKERTTEVLAFDHLPFAFIARVRDKQHMYEKEPVIGYKDSENNNVLRWDNGFPKTETGYRHLTSVDIALILKNEGHVKVGTHREDILVWAKQVPVFQQWMQKTLDIKEQGAREGNEALRSLGKMLGNSTYGGTLKRTYRQVHKIVKTEAQKDRFLREHELTGATQVYDGWLLTGKLHASLNEPSDVSTVLGAFVLAYSRLELDRFISICMPPHVRRCSDYMTKLCNGELPQQVYYGDTDSIIIHRSMLLPLLKHNCLGSGNGLLTDDVYPKKFSPSYDEAVEIWRQNPAEDIRICRIIDYIAIAPKSYGITYLSPEDGYQKERHVVKLKGIPQSSVQSYKEKRDDGREVTHPLMTVALLRRLLYEDGFTLEAACHHKIKRYRATFCNRDVQSLDKEAFSNYNYTLSRSIHSHWNGRRKLDTERFPHITVPLSYGLSVNDQERDS